jgi:outer membrane protein insertion porin family
MRSSISILAVLFLSVIARAQFGGPVYVSAPSMYQGQKVGTIDVAANPKINVDAFRALLRQSPNVPYSTQDVQASLNALNHTGRFNKVELEVKPEPNGLRLTFVLQPALYFGLVEFPGADKKFTYTRLLQVVNVPSEEPYAEHTVQDGADALLAFLQKTGYFEAVVKPVTQFDEQHQLANVIYQVTLNKRAKVGKVSFNGVTPQQQAKLVSALHSIGARARGDSLKTGQTFTAARIKNATIYLRRYLSGENRLVKELRPGQIQYHPDTRHADISFDVRLGPSVSVKLQGAKLTWVPFLENRKLHQLIPIFEESSADPDLITEGEHNLINFFQDKGYFDVKVRYDVQRNPNQVNVLYVVDKGKKHKVEEVSIAGNHHFSDKQLLDEIPVKEGNFIKHGRYSDKLVKDSVKTIKTLYENNGYQDVKVTPKVVDKEPKIYVTFNVEEGQQTTVEALHIQGNRTLGIGAIEPKGGFSLSPGLPFSQLRMKQDRNHIVAAYLDRGYPRITFSSKINYLPQDKHKVEVTYVLNEGQQVRISEVYIEGQKHTKPKYISRTMDIGPENPLSQTELLASESRLYDVGIFDYASVGPKKAISNETEEEVVAKVHESKRNSITYGFGFEYDRRAGSVPSGTAAIPGLPPVGLGKTQFATSESAIFGPRGSVEWIRRNMRGLGETMSMSALVGRLDQKGVFEYADPNFRWTHWRSLFSMSAERTSENPLFTARLGQGSFQLERYLDRAQKKTFQVRYSFQRTNLTNLLIPQLVLPADRNVRLSMLSTALIEDSRDKPLDAHKGMFQTINLDIAPRSFGSNFSFTRFLAQRAMYIPIKKQLVWANRVELGTAQGFGGSTVPTSERFFSGGSNTLRGFPVDGAGPQRPVPVCSNPAAQTGCSNISVPVGGNRLFIFNSELRFPTHIMKNLGAAAFYDGGNVYGPLNLRNFVDNFSNTVGFGIRYNTPIGPIRFDIGHNLNPVPGFRSTQFFVTLGQAF